jgi:hypothetical protein
MVMSMVLWTRAAGEITESWASAVISMKAPSTPPCKAGITVLPTRCGANGRVAVISSPASSARMPRKPT